jgi:hypothetical protein
MITKCFHSKLMIDFNILINSVGLLLLCFVFLKQGLTVAQAGIELEILLPELPK